MVAGVILYGQRGRDENCKTLDGLYFQRRRPERLERPVERIRARRRLLRRSTVGSQIGVPTDGKRYFTDGLFFYHFLRGVFGFDFFFPEIINAARRVVRQRGAAAISMRL